MKQLYQAYKTLADMIQYAQKGDKDMVLKLEQEFERLSTKPNLNSSVISIYENCRQSCSLMFTRFPGDKNRWIKDAINQFVRIPVHIDKKLEQRLKQVAWTYISKSKKADWDIPHTEAAAYYMKELIKAEGGNSRIFIPAIYLHDIGYSLAIKSDNPDMDSTYDKKPAHMKLGADAARKIVTGLEFYPVEIDQIVHLVEVHDELDKIKTFAEQMVFEADSLAQLDTKRVKPTWSKEDRGRWMERWQEKRVLLFKTETGIRLKDKLLPIALNYNYD